MQLQLKQIAYQQKFMNKLITTFVVIITTTLLTSCIKEKCVEIDFSKFNDANRIRTSTSHDETINEINDKKTILALINFMQKREQAWCQSPFGTPIGPIRAELYTGEKFLGSVGIGVNFMVAEMWYDRQINTEERTKILGILGIPNQKFG